MANAMFLISEEETKRLLDSLEERRSGQTSLGVSWRGGVHTQGEGVLRLVDMRKRRTHGRAK